MVPFHTYEDLPENEQVAFLEKQGMTESEYLTKRNANLEHQLEGFRLLLVRQERDLRDAGLIESTQHLKINVPVCID